MSDQFIALIAWLGFTAASLGGAYALGSCTCRVQRVMTGATWSTVTLSVVLTFLWLGQPHHAAHAAMVSADGQMPAMPITAIGE